MSEKMLFLDIEKVDPPMIAARDFIDPESVRELAESIRDQGLYEPIIVRPLNGRYEIVMGHRRWLAHRLIAKTTIKSIIREMSDEEVEIARAVENDQREDLNPIEKAKGYQRLRDKFNLSQEQIGQKMGRSRETIIRFLKLLKIPEEFQIVLAKKKLSIGVALCLNEIDDDISKRYYFTAAVENGVTLEVAQSWVTDYFKTRSGTVEGSGGGLGVGGAIQEPLPIFQTCICCAGPVEVSKVHYVPVCPPCEAEIRGALKPK